MQDSLLYYERQSQKPHISENCDELTSGLKSLPHVAMTCASSTTNRAICLLSYGESGVFRSVVLACSLSGVIYNKHSSSRRALSSWWMVHSSVAFLRSCTSMPLDRNALTWSSMRAFKGPTTTVTPCVVPERHRAGSWKQRLFPPPVGTRTRTSRPESAYAMANYCFGRNDSSPNRFFETLSISG